MQIYHFSEQTSEFVGSGDARESPREPGTFLIPRLSTNIAPPRADPNEVAVFDGSAWNIEPDFRGWSYKVGTVVTVITEIGDTIPAEATEVSDTSSPPPELTPEEKLELARQATTADRFEVGRGMFEGQFITRDEAGAWIRDGPLPVAWQTALATVADPGERTLLEFDLENKVTFGRMDDAIELIRTQENFPPEMFDLFFSVEI